MLATESPPACASCRLCIEQPPNWEHTSVDGVFIKQMFLKDEGTLVPQHSHRYDHTSMLATGALRVWKDGVYDRDYEAPAPIFIAAKVKHTFQALKPETLVYCVHNASRTGEVEIHELHEFASEEDLAIAARV